MHSNPEMVDLHHNNAKHPTQCGSDEPILTKPFGVIMMCMTLHTTSSPQFELAQMNAPVHTHQAASINVTTSQDHLTYLLSILGEFITGGHLSSTNIQTHTGNVLHTYQVLTCTTHSQPSHLSILYICTILHHPVRPIPASDMFQFTKPEGSFKVVNHDGFFHIRGWSCAIIYYNHQPAFMIMHHDGMLNHDRNACRT